MRNPRSIDGRVNWRGLSGAVLAVACGLVLPAAAASGRGQYDTQYVVPAAGRVAIDGRLDDWDLSAQIQACVVRETADTQSARFAIMYDAEAVYLSGVVRDTSPMMNRHDPEASGHKAWDADACQFRLVVDAASAYPVKENVFQFRGSKEAKQRADKRDDIVHLILWHYTDRDEANLQMHIGMTYRVPRPKWAPHGVVPRDLFSGKYRKAEDGRGYTFEYRIPWKTLGAKKPLAAGAEVAGTVQFNWSRPDGLKTAGGSAWAYEIMSKPGFPFQDASCWGKLVFRETGNVPRDLVDGGLPKPKPLPLTFEYDVPEDSEVTVQLVDDENMIVRTLVAQGRRNAGRNVEKWDGLDDSGKPLPVGTYRWKGIYHEPIQATWRFSVHNSGRPPYPTPNNKGGWGADHGVPTCAARVPGGMLLGWSGAEYGWGVIRVDSEGRKLWGSKHSASHIACDGKRYFTADQAGFHSAPGVKVFNLKDSRPLAWGNGNAYLLPPPGAPSGDERANDMTGLAYADRKIYVAYRNRSLIGVFDGDTGELMTTWSVPTPTYLACRDDATVLAVCGDRVIAVRGGSTREVVRAYPDDPRGIAVGDDGTIYLANRGRLMNVSVFSRTGRFLKSIGRRGGRNAVGAYQPDGMFQPAGIAVGPEGRLWVAEQSDYPKRISCWDTRSGRLHREYFGASSYFGYCFIDPARPDEVYGHNVIWKVDWKKYTTTPVSTIWRRTKPNDMCEVAPDGYRGHLRVFTRDDGTQYAYGNGSGASVLSVRTGDIFRPHAAFLTLGKKKRPFGLADAGLKDGKYLWVDADDDGAVQPGELDRATVRIHHMNMRAVDPTTMTIWIGEYSLAPHAFRRGRPLYRAGDIKKNVLAGKPGKPGGGYVWLDPDGSVFSLRSGGRPSWAKWSRDGKMLVGYPGIPSWRKSLGLPIVKAGRLWGMTGPLGVAGEFTGNMTYFGVNHIFMRDGTYVAAIGYDGRVGGHPSLQGQPEGQRGALVKLDIDGQGRYFLLHGGQDGRVIELLGLETIERLHGGRYVLSEEDAAKVAAAQAGAAGAGMPSEVAIGTGKRSLQTASAVGKDLEGTRAFRARLAYDAKNLYARFTVNADHPLVNRQPDPRLIFKGGNLLDIQLGTDPRAEANRKKPAAGDVRLLVSRDARKKAKAVLFRPRVAGFAGERIVLKSPTGQEPFDAVTDVSGQVGIEYRDTAKGFEAIVTVPLRTIGFAPRRGMKVKCDLGYVFGNASGTRAMVRAYWRNNGFTANVVDDIPHESRLEPGAWGTAVVE